MKSLGSAPSIKSLEKKRNEKIKQRDMINDTILTKKEELNSHIIKESPKILARKAFVDSLELIKKSHDESYMYPIDESILEDSINDNSCKLCDRKFDEQLLDYIKSKKAKLYLISPEDKILNENKRYFSSFKDIKDKYLKKETSLQKEISDNTGIVETLENEIKEYYDVIKVNEHLRENINRRDELVRILPTKQSELDSLKNNISELKREVNKLHDEYLKLLEDEEEYKEILAKIKLCMDSLNVINDGRNKK